MRAIDKKSFRELAEMVVNGKLAVYQYYAEAPRRLISTERAEQLLIETRERIEAKRARESQQAELFALRILDGAGKLTAGRAFGLGLGRKAVAK